jgi:hypothetical protein
MFKPLTQIDDDDNEPQLHEVEEYNCIIPSPPFELGLVNDDEKEADSTPYHESEEDDCVIPSPPIALEKMKFAFRSVLKPQSLFKQRGFSKPVNDTQWLTKPITIVKKVTPPPPPRTIVVKKPNWLVKPLIVKQHNT